MQDLQLWQGCFEVKELISIVIIRDVWLQCWFFFFSERTPPSVLGPKTVVGIPVPDSDAFIVGLSISWENRDSYFVSLMSACNSESGWVFFFFLNSCFCFVYELLVFVCVVVVCIFFLQVRNLVFGSQAWLMLLDTKLLKSHLFFFFSFTAF